MVNYGVDGSWKRKFIDMIKKGLPWKRPVNSVKQLQLLSNNRE